MHQSFDSTLFDSAWFPWFWWFHNRFSLKSKLPFVNQSADRLDHCPMSLVSISIFKGLSWNKELISNLSAATLQQWFSYCHVSNIDRRWPFKTKGLFPSSGFRQLRKLSQVSRVSRSRYTLSVVFRILVQLNFVQNCRKTVASTEWVHYSSEVRSGHVMFPVEFPYCDDFTTAPKFLRNWDFRLWTIMQQLRQRD